MAETEGGQLSAAAAPAQALHGAPRPPARCLLVPGCCGARPGGVGGGGRREGRCKNVTTLLFILPTCMLSLGLECLSSSRKLVDLPGEEGAAVCSRGGSHVAATAKRVLQ